MQSFLEYCTPRPNQRFITPANQLSAITVSLIEQSICGSAITGAIFNNASQEKKFCFLSQSRVRLLGLPTFLCSSVIVITITGRQRLEAAKFSTLPQYLATNFQLGSPRPLGSGKKGRLGKYINYLANSVTQMHFQLQNAYLNHLDRFLNTYIDHGFRR